MARTGIPGASEVRLTAMRAAGDWPGATPRLRNDRSTTEDATSAVAWQGRPPGLGPGEALLEDGLFGGVGGQLEGKAVGGAGLVRVAEVA
jgi:hypothetical protein